MSPLMGWPKQEIFKVVTLLTLHFFVINSHFFYRAKNVTNSYQYHGQLVKTWKIKSKSVWRGKVKNNLDSLPHIHPLRTKFTCGGLVEGLTTIKLKRFKPDLSEHALPTVPLHL